MPVTPFIGGAFWLSSYTGTTQTVSNLNGGTNFPAGSTVFAFIARDRSDLGGGADWSTTPKVGGSVTMTKAKGDYVNGSTTSGMELWWADLASSTADSITYGDGVQQAFAALIGGYLTGVATGGPGAVTAEAQIGSLDHTSTTIHLSLTVPNGGIGLWGFYADSAAIGAGLTPVWTNAAASASDEYINSSAKADFAFNHALGTGSAVNVLVAPTAGASGYDFICGMMAAGWGPAAATLVTGWNNTQADVFHRKPKPLSAAPAFVSAFRTAGISGVAWQALRENDKLPKGKYLTDPVALSYVPAIITWAFSVGDTTFLRDAPKDDPPALERPIVQPVGISGIAWFEPADRDRPRVRVTFEALPAIALTPATLPPPIAGMAWLEPRDLDRTSARVKVDYPPAFGQAIVQPVGISGMAWFEAPDRFAPARAIRDDAPPQTYGGALPITTYGWFVPTDWRVPGVRMINEQQEAGVFGPLTSVGVSGMAWFAPLDLRPPGVRIYQPAAALVLKKPAPPVGVSGMAWFAPPDHDRAAFRASIETMPAWSVSLSITVTPSKGIFAHLDVHGAMPFDEFNTLAARPS